MRLHNCVRFIRLFYNLYSFLPHCKHLNKEASYDLRFLP